MTTGQADPADPAADAVGPADSTPGGSPPVGGIHPDTSPGSVTTPAGRRLQAGDWQVAAWRSFLRTHAHLFRRLESDLNVHHKISMGAYDVLVQLAEAPDNRLRMSELADAVLLSRSGLTRLVDRMQHDGLVQRQPDPDDARGLYTVMTDQGLIALRDASRVHLDSIDELVVKRLTDEELTTLQMLMSKIDPQPVP